MDAELTNRANIFDDRSSFFVKIMYRQNTSWQGEVQWMEGRRTQRFRSMLELVSLIEEALSESGCPEAHYKLRRWQQGSSEQRNLADTEESGAS